MRIYLADLAHTASVADGSIPVPLSVGYVGATVRAAYPGQVEVRLFKHPDLLLRAATSSPPDVIGFANYGWSQRLTTEVGRYLRAHLPGAVLVAGGPNIDQQEHRLRAFLQHNAHLDYLVLDGGEEPFTELVGLLLQGADPHQALPANVCFLHNGDQVVRASVRRLTRAVEGIASPYLSGMLDEFLERGMVPLLETNRGCPFSCTFCAWGDASKNLVRRFPLETVLDEIRYVGERSRSQNWIVCDANFGILERDVEIATHIRAVRETHGFPRRCHVWLAKNVTERNLEIGRIFGDMTVPVMAVQSLDQQVLKNIKRSNISTQTYVDYQRQFHDMGSITYSDLIVPLPGETLETHLRGLADLFDFGVDEIECHNMRLLAGAEASSDETRQQFGFRTRYRLIHGDSGIYGQDVGANLRVFEYEESLRSTTTMSETELFYLRKLHFLVFAAWNYRIYRPLLQLMALYGVNQVDVLRALLRAADGTLPGVDPVAASQVRGFFEQFDRSSHDEWFDSAADIERSFADPDQFARLLDGEFEKLNVQYSMFLLRDVKPAFDRVLADVCRSYGAVSEELLAALAEYTFAIFPPLTEGSAERALRLPANLPELDPGSAPGFRCSDARTEYRFRESERRRAFRDLLGRSAGQTLSKILNVQYLSVAALALSPEPALTFQGDPASRSAQHGYTGPRRS